MNNILEKTNIVIEKAYELGCQVLVNEELKKHTSFKIGGICNAMISLKDEKSASELFLLCNSENCPYLLIGKGSNMLISDDGFNGVVFLIGNDFSEIKLLSDNTIECEAGAPLSKVSNFACKNSLTGFEFAWGIPGTIGGALLMNAGAYGGEMKDVVLSCNAVGKDGKIYTFNKDDMQLSYRHSFFSDNEFIITKVVLCLDKGNAHNIRTNMDMLMQKRIDKQPLEYPSAGSTFKRPEGAYAAALIEECGLKGLSVGGAEVSTKHSGFIINKNNATSKDVIELIEKVKATVKEKTGYNLECEVKII